MGEFSKQLCSIRAELGFRSALKFFQHLQTRDAVSVNYTQYKRIESGTVLASTEFVRKLARALPEYANDLIQRACQDQFPDYKDLFQVSSAPLKTLSEKAPLLYPQDELTPNQISVIASSEIHYFTYLVFTMARRPLSISELHSGLRGFKESVIEDLTKVRLLTQEAEAFRAVSIERLFPAANSKALKEAYLKMDEWDLKISNYFKTEKIAKRSTFRRVSPRYIPIIQKYYELFMDQLFASDESDRSKNVDAISFSIDIKKIKLPG